MRADGRAIAEHGAVDQVLAVDGMGDGLAHLDVVQGRAGVVHGKDGLALGRADGDLEARIGLDLGQRFGRGIDQGRRRYRQAMIAAKAAVGSAMKRKVAVSAPVFFNSRHGRSA